MRLFIQILFGLFAAASANASLSANIEGDRIKIQIRGTKNNNTNGGFELRRLLIKDGYDVDTMFEFNTGSGMVETQSSLDPLRMYNYLYDNGAFVFTIFLPIDDQGLFLTDTSLVFSGKAAKLLFDLLKRHLKPRHVGSLEQYRFANRSYCDDLDNYRCRIEFTK